jgi:glycosyltransferase involved in cell wall biosynthesis
MTRPDVSVCIPARDHGRFLHEAVASALGQDGVDLEVIVHDDASTDATATVLAGFDDPRVRWRRHARRVGVAANRNSCVAAARGRNVAWLDADDAYLAGALARQLAVLDDNPRVVLVHAGFEVVGEDGEPKRRWPAPFPGDAIETSAVAFRQLLASNEITTSTVLVRRSSLHAAGRFSGAAGPSGSDWAMWLRVALRGNIAYSAAPVARYRQHDQSISHATVRTGRRLLCDVRIATRVLREERGRLPDGPGLRRLSRAALASKAIAHAGDARLRGDRRAMLATLGLATRLAPGAVGRLLPALLLAAVRQDDPAWMRLAGQALARLAPRLAGTRHGERLEAAAVADADWDAVLIRIARVVRRIVPPDAKIATVAKWDPTLLRLSRRRGQNFPDLRQLPEGYPRQGATVVEHLEAVRRDGISHLVIPSASFWWLEHYADFARHLARYPTAWRDPDCRIFDLREGRAARS